MMELEWLPFGIDIGHWVHSPRKIDMPKARRAFRRMEQPELARKRPSDNLSGKALCQVGHKNLVPMPTVHPIEACTMCGPRLMYEGVIKETPD